MDDFIAARSQMALSLGFHIVFSCIGMVMPFFMAIAHFYWLKTKDPVYRNITKAWSKGVAIFFATGAVSGTVLSFELGLLWPSFMKHAGPIFGMPFSLEGTAFFIEAIALGFAGILGVFIGKIAIILRLDLAPVVFGHVFPL